MADFKTWGERLFPEAVVGRKGADIRLSSGRVSPKSVTPSPLRQSNPKQRVNKLVKRLVQKAPEVMVKITGNGKSISKIKGHVDYISRNGKVELEDQDGLVYNGKGAVNDILDDWADSGGIPKHESEARLRETFNVVLSMPKDTDRDALKNAARAFAKENFEGHEWFMAEHRDTDQPHVHICIKTANQIGYRLNPKKADLQKWREGFADKLNEHGVEANATKRQVRGRTRRPRTQAQYHARKNKRPLRNEQRQREEAKREIETGVKRVESPALKQAKKTREDVMGNFADAVQELHKNGDTAIARELIKHARSLPLVESTHENIIRRFKEKYDGGRDKTEVVKAASTPSAANQLKKGEHER